MAEDEIIIVDAEGGEHIFPASVGPKRAAEIVRGRTAEGTFRAGNATHADGSPVVAPETREQRKARAFREFDEQRANFDRATWNAGPGKAWEGAKRLVSGPTWDDRAGGLSDVVVGGGLTAAGLFAPSLVRAALAAPIVTGATVVGGAVGAPVARAIATGAGAGEGVQDLAETAGGLVGGGVGNRAGRPVARGAQRAGEWLYQKAGYGNTASAVRGQMAAQASGEAPPESLARSVMARGITGKPVDAGAQFLDRLNTVEPMLQRSAARRIVPNLQNRERVAATLDMLAGDVADLPYGSEVVPEATALAGKLRANDALLATDMLRVKRLLDSARLSSTYKLNPSLSAKQAELQRASDDVRRAFHRSDPDLSALLNDEHVAVQGLEAAINTAVRQGRSDIVQALDPMVALVGEAAAGPVGLIAPLARRGLKASSVLTRTGQALYRAGGGERVGIPPEAPARVVAGQLTEGARPMPPSPDPSYARGVPAEVAISGRPRQLTAGRRTLVTPPPDQPVKPPPTADPSGVRSVPAAPLSYEVNPLIPVKQGAVKVSQFSGDPEAARAALVEPRTRQMLERMREDLDTFTPSRGGLVRESLDSLDTHYVYSTPGSPVGDDIRVISEQNVSNRAIRRAISELLDGRMPSNKLHTAAIDAALGYLERRPGYRGPAMGTSDLDDPAFAAFSRSIDEVAGE